MLTVARLGNGENMWGLNLAIYLGIKNKKNGVLDNIANIPSWIVWGDWELRLVADKAGRLEKRTNLNPAAGSLSDVLMPSDSTRELL